MHQVDLGRSGPTPEFKGLHGGFKEQLGRARLSQDSVLEARGQELG